MSDPSDIPTQDELNDIYRQYQPQNAATDRRLIQVAELEVEMRQAESRLEQAKVAGDTTAVKLFKADVRAARVAYRQAAHALGVRDVVRVVDNDGTAEGEVD